MQGGATAGDDREMNNEPLERKPIDRVRARLEALLKANAAPRCGARSKRTGKPCQGAAMPNGRCKFHGGMARSLPSGENRSAYLNAAEEWERRADQEGGALALKKLEHSTRGFPTPAKLDVAKVSAK